MSRFRPWRRGAPRGWRPQRRSHRRACRSTRRAMDLCNGARKVIVAMELTTKKGEPKILKKCTYPLTAQGCVNHIVTEQCVIDVTPEGLKLVEIRAGKTPEDIQAQVEPTLIIADDLKIMDEE